MDLMMETPIETQQEEVKDEVNDKPANKPTKKVPSSKKGFSKKVVREKLTDEVFNEITQRNKDEGIPIRNLCEDYNVAYSSFNTKKKKQEISTNNQKQVTKAKPKAATKPRESLEQVKTNDTSRIKELEQDCNYLRKEYMDLLLKYNRLLSKK